MANARALRLRSMEGTIVNVELCDGSRIERCRLVSSGRANVGTLWLAAAGEDLFVRLGEVSDVWHADRLEVRAA
jgi:hypothetical protein